LNRPFELLQKNTYGFHFVKGEITDIAEIRYFGFEERFPTDDYFRNCQTNKDVNACIFQYTLSGRGEFAVNNQIYELNPGQGFMVTIPTSCIYYLPKSSENWKFIYITLWGKEAKRCWEHLIEQNGHVFEIPTESFLIQQLFSIYAEVIKGNISDAYASSSIAFSFISNCYKYFKNDKQDKEPELPKEIKAAIGFIKENYHLSVTLDDIAAQANLSKYYFTKKFKEFFNTPPLTYLNNYRIEKALHLLQYTKKSVKTISIELGFTDPNYFSKAFRANVGISPGAFRKANPSQQNLDFLITDNSEITKLSPPSEAV